MSNLEKKVEEFSDDYLLEQYLVKKNEYTEESIAVLKNEVEKRGLSTGDVEYHEDLEVDYDIKDFKPFPHGFNDTDYLIATAILEENDVPCYAGSSESSNTIPIEAEAGKFIQIFVPEALMVQAQELIDYQFISEDGQYRVKLDSLKDQCEVVYLYRPENISTIEIK